MRVLHINSYDRRGGAGIAAWRLMEAQLNEGIDALMLVKRKESDIDAVIEYEPKTFDALREVLVYKLIGRRLMKRYRTKPDAQFCLGMSGVDIAGVVQRFKPDIINLHWVCDRFINIKGVHDLAATGIPLVWTLHDMWPFTGGCHFSGGCEEYTRSCGSCPVLGSNEDDDISHDLLNQKLEHFRGVVKNIAVPSNWMADCARRSSVFSSAHVEVIANNVPAEGYDADYTAQCRSEFGFSAADRVILFGAENLADERKGGRYLLEALRLFDSPENIKLLVFGENSEHAKALTDFDVTCCGKLKPGQMRKLYTAADVFVAPSVEDNLPNTIAESLVCGTPVVAFKVGGIPDMITDAENGFLATPFDIKELYVKVYEALEVFAAKSFATKISSNAIAKYSPEQQVERYNQFYQRILSLGL